MYHFPVFLLHQLHFLELLSSKIKKGHEKYINILEGKLGQLKKNKGSRSLIILTRNHRVNQWVRLTDKSDSDISEKKKKKKKKKQEAA